MDGHSIAFEQPLPDLGTISNAEFLQAISWKRTAGVLRDAAATGNDEKFLKKWRALKSERLTGDCNSSRSTSESILWSQFAFPQTDRLDELISILTRFESADGKRPKKIAADSAKAKGRKTKKRSRQTAARLAEWLSNVAPEKPPAPFELLMLLHMCVRYDENLPADIFATLWRVSLSAVIDLSNRISGASGNSDDLNALPEDQRLVLTGEIPWLAGLLFADVKGAGTLRRSAKKVLCRALLDRTDTDGTPHGQLLERLSVWMAPLVRSAAASELFATELWSPKAAERFERLVQAAAPLCRADGRIALSNGVSHQPVAVLKQASRLAGLQKSTLPRSYLKHVGSGPEKKNKRKWKTAKKAVPPATQSDWAQFALLRSDWSPFANSLVVAHHGESPLVDLTALGRPLLSGPWEIELKIDGKPISLDGEWVCSCWFSDKDADFLELQMKLDCGLQIDRQLLLSRTDDFALLADAVSGGGDYRIDYESRLPLLENVHAESNPESRELRLNAPRPFARVFPLALPQDHFVSTPASFHCEDDHLILQQVSSRQGLFAPLVFDWSARRSRSHADWRTLTVTEAREEVESGIAAGHRLRVGNHQLFIYRSLCQAERARSILGHHTTNETVIGRFDQSGEVDPILLVE